MARIVSSQHGRGFFRIIIEVHGPYSNEHLDYAQAEIQRIVNEALAEAEARRRKRYLRLVRKLTKNIKLQRFQQN